MCEPNEGLDDEEYVGCESKDCVYRFEMWNTVLVFVYLYHNPGCDEGGKREVIEDGVGIGSFFLLLCCMRGLENEGALSEEE